ncbi:hypothetical protein BDZ91DRAFT_447606 [Kalaharituber pfeilii]|nr:hypothetical protein BDZ91DRAFT_447606 [Kalaharituber pfeilii]
MVPKTRCTDSSSLGLTFPAHTSFIHQHDHEIPIGDHKEPVCRPGYSNHCIRLHFHSFASHYVIFHFVAAAVYCCLGLSQ